MQQVEPQRAAWASPIDVCPGWFQDLAVMLPIQLLASVPWKAGEDGPSTWAPAPTREPQMEPLAPGCSLAQPQPLQSSEA